MIMMLKRTVAVTVVAMQWTKNMRVKATCGGGDFVRDVVHPVFWEALCRREKRKRRGGRMKREQR